MICASVVKMYLASFMKFDGSNSKYKYLFFFIVCFVFFNAKSRVCVFASITMLFKGVLALLFLFIVLLLALAFFFFLTCTSPPGNNSPCDPREFPFARL